MNGHQMREPCLADNPARSIAIAATAILGDASRSLFWPDKYHYNEQDLAILLGLPVVSYQALMKMRLGMPLLLNPSG